MRKYGLIGFPLTHSFSKSYFTSKFEREGKIDFCYENCEIQQIEELQTLLNDTSFAGFNVTIPWKQEIISCLDEISFEALEIGAVNVIQRTSTSKLKGFNTDIIGFRETLIPLLKYHHSSALILGSGGASKAVSFVLKMLKIDFKIVTRNPTEINEIGYNELTPNFVHDNCIIINTTPIGMYPNENNFPEIHYEAIGEFHLLYDLVYNPAETLFLKKGREKGAITFNGYDMLIRQAEESWKIWMNK
jgi:shikimate dehydrogenase